MGTPAVADEVIARRWAKAREVAASKGGPDIATPQDDCRYLVQGSEQVYTVNLLEGGLTSCTCEAGVHGWPCYHQAAAVLYRERAVAVSLFELAKDLAGGNLHLAARALSLAARTASVLAEHATDNPGED